MDLAQLFGHLLRTSEFEDCVATRFLRRHSCSEVSLPKLFNMELKFAVEFPSFPLFSAAQPAHETHSYSAVRRISAIAPATRSQESCSCASCFRPLAESL